MKKILVIILVALLLTGCGAPQAVNAYKSQAIENVSKI